MLPSVYYHSVVKYFFQHLLFFLQTSDIAHTQTQVVEVENNCVFVRHQCHLQMFTLLTLTLRKQADGSGGCSEFEIYLFAFLSASAQLA